MKFIQDFKDSFKARMEAEQCKVMVGFGVDVGGLLGFASGKIIQSNLTLGYYGTPSNKVGAIACANGFIYVNDAFMAIDSLAVKQAIVAHELGHIEHNHLVGASTIGHLASRLLPWETEATRKEFEADAYAKAKGYNIVDALQYMLETKAGNVSELRRRIKKLEAS